MHALAGQLGQQVIAAERRALQSGALQPIPVTFEWRQDAGLPFLVRQVRIPPRKTKPTAADEPRPNPFLPYDPALFVADLGPQHVCLLNKFPVIPRHTLIVTRHFEHQQTPLNAADLTSWWRGLTSYPSLGFYNGGTIAGASQPHKHMQVVPLPLEKGSGVTLPWESWVLEALRETAGPGPCLNAVRQFRFTHVAARLDGWATAAADEVGRLLESLYRCMLEQVELGVCNASDGRLARPYNLLLTPRWMLMVPRRHESFATISLNGLAFAGAVLVWNSDQWHQLSRQGLLAALEHVAFPLF